MAMVVRVRSADVSTHKYDSYTLRAEGRRNSLSSLLQIKRIHTRPPITPAWTGRWIYWLARRRLRLCSSRSAYVIRRASRSRSGALPLSKDGRLQTKDAELHGHNDFVLRTPVKVGNREVLFVLFLKYESFFQHSDRFCDSHSA